MLFRIQNLSITSLSLACETFIFIIQNIYCISKIYYKVFLLSFCIMQKQYSFYITFLISNMKTERVRINAH